MTNLGLVPLSNFGEVAPHIYRSAQPEYAYQYGWLKNMIPNLVIVNLRAESDRDAQMWDGEEFQIAVEDHRPPTLAQATQFIDLLREHIKEGKNILIHCEHGHGRTSTFSVLAKVAMGQSVVDAIEDELERFHYQFKHKGQGTWLLDNADTLERFVRETR